jgi:exopolysaccharide biosynthesis polyprenyl glycosylphosphotransferase
MLLLVRFGHRNIEPGALLASTLASGAIWIAFFAYAGLYRRSLARSWHDEIYWVAAISAIAILPQLLLYTLLPQISTSRLLLLVALPMDIAMVSVMRALLRKSWETRGELRARILFIGAPRDLQVSMNRFGLSAATTTFAIPVQGWPDAFPAFGHLAQTEYDRWFACAKAWGADRLVFTRLPPRRSMKALIATAAQQRIPIAFASRKTITDGGACSIEQVGSESVLVPALPHVCMPDAQAAKRAIDLIFACAGLILFGPVMIAAALAVWIDSGAPIVYRQERIGQAGRAFQILKFRSMRRDAESAGAVWATSGDTRVTRIGKFLRRTSIDELPQIFNVLRGEMSIVGPRPERSFFVERFRQQLERYDERHLVRPGITGWSHVYMQRDADQSVLAERLAYDLFYIEHWSPTMDLSIILKTGCEFLLHRIAA